MKVNYHVHCEYSDDSIYPIEEVVKDAINLKIDEICFTDHVDYGIKKDWIEGNIEYRSGEPIANVDYPAYFKAIRMLQEKYKNQISIKKGLEFGMQQHTIPQFKKLFDEYQMDFVILSCHQIGNKEFWTNDYQHGKTQKEIHEGYYTEILNLVKQYKDYSVLGHLDVITRYDPYGDYPFEYIKEMVKEILQIVIQDGKGIEVNTSCFHYGLKDLTPSRDILKLYYDLGGRLITIGSDSHKKEHLNSHLEEIKEELKNIGFTQFYTFESMKPIPHNL